MSQIHVDTGLAKCTQAEEHKGDTEDEVTYDLALLAIDEDDGDEERQPHKVGDVEWESCTHDPGGERGTDIGTHDNRNSLGKGEETGIYEWYRHHRRSSRRLYGSRDERTREYARQTIGGHSS